MIRDCNVVCLAGCEWDFTWQPTQELMLRLAQAGNRVLYVEPTGTRSVKLSDWRRVLARLRTKLAGAATGRAIPPTLTVYTPLILPFPHSAFARAVNRWILGRAIRRWRGQQPLSQVVLWLYFPSPLNVDLARMGGWDATVYHVMSSAEAARPHRGILEANEALLKECDLVFANSRRLWQQAAQVNKRAYLFRASVNLELFAATPPGDSSRPDGLIGLSGPLVGYIGALHQWMDVDLLMGVAQAMPDCQFVLVGPLVREIDRLRALPNVHWLGQKSHSEIPRYVRQFDACLIPYTRDAYTETSYPAKLNEYLSLGKPVVATPLPELVDYNREYGEVLLLAEDAPSFVAALRKAVYETTSVLRERYRQVAQQNSWSVRVEEMSHIIEDELYARLGQT